jgi:hypothetical protein
MKSLLKIRNFIGALAVCLWLAGSGAAQGQWLTQSFNLKAGWNAIYLHVDSSHATLDELIGNDPANPIQEVWLWTPQVSAQQFVDSPQLPTDSGSQWITWSRSLGVSSPLQRLEGNAACLVRVDANSGPYAFQVKGKVVPPRYEWTSAGLNFIGFPTPAINPPSFENFLAKAPALQQEAEIYRYPGGELGQTNPVRVFAPRTTFVNRGEAVWIRAGASFNKYFGPFEIELQNSDGAHFGNASGQYRIRIRNITAGPLTVGLAMIDSDTAPAGQKTVQGAPPLLVRGERNLADLAYGYQSLNGTNLTWTLTAKGQPGSQAEIIVGLNRSQMSGAPGDLFAGILRFTDNIQLSQMDIPVSAEVSSHAGLWVGEASVKYVSHYLKNFARATNQTDFSAMLVRMQLAEGQDGYHYVWDEATGKTLVYGGPENKTGSYLLDGPIKVDSGRVGQPFPLRLILHNDGTETRLLQRAYFGIGLGTNAIISTSESLLLKAQLSSARRISAVHLPVSASNVPWTCSGDMAEGQSLSVTIPLAYDNQAANPFLHTYHPDHDNLDASFQAQLPEGVESYGVTRRITLNFTPPADTFESLTMGSQALTGDYVEVITFRGKGGHTKEFNSLGTFALNRISAIDTLTMP